MFLRFVFFLRFSAGSGEDISRIIRISGPATSQMAGNWTNQRQHFPNFPEQTSGIISDIQDILARFLTRLLARFLTTILTRVLGTENTVYSSSGGEPSGKFPGKLRKSPENNLDVSRKSFVREMSGKFGGNALEISWKLPGNVQDISRTCPGNFREMSGKCPVNFQEMHRKFP